MKAANLAWSVKARISSIWKPPFLGRKKAQAAQKNQGAEYLKTQKAIQDYEPQDHGLRTENGGQTGNRANTDMLRCFRLHSFNRQAIAARYRIEFFRAGRAALTHLAQEIVRSVRAKSV
jgi:hypothetical protein